MSTLPCLSVSEFNTTIQHLLEEELALDDLWISGELSNLKTYAQGKQIYFTLSDRSASLNGLMFEFTLERLNFTPQNGQKLYCRGRVRFFQKRGQFMFQATYMSLEGSGANAQQLEALKQKLLAEGLFDPNRKKSIPAYPKRLLLITSENSAAMADFFRICHDQAPSIELILVPATMQGLSAPASIMDAFSIAERTLDNPKLKPDAIILLRGGGSAEDLSCFNHEGLVRTVAASSIPVVTAIGHEVDFTLADFASDYRCSTPSNAAHFLTQKTKDAALQIQRHILDVQHTLERRLENLANTIQGACVDSKNAVSTRLALKDQHLKHLEIRLIQANPLHKLRQGFSICRNAKTHEILRSVSTLKEDDTITTSLIDGSVTSRVLGVTCHSKPTSKN